MRTPQQVADHVVRELKIQALQNGKNSSAYFTFTGEYRLVLEEAGALLTSRNIPAKIGWAGTRDDGEIALIVDGKLPDWFYTLNQIEPGQPAPAAQAVVGNSTDVMVPRSLMELCLQLVPKGSPLHDQISQLLLK